MASRIQTNGDGDKKKKSRKPMSCTVVGGEMECAPKKKDTSKEPKKKYYKEIEYTEKKSEVKPETVDIKHRTVETKSDDKGATTIYKGKTEEYTGNVKSGFKKGEEKDVTVESGNKGETVSKLLETRFYKKRSKLGRLLTGEKTRQKGGILQEEKDGKTETITYKGKGRGTKKYVSTEHLEEYNKKTYDKKKKEFEEANKGKELTRDQKEELGALTYASKKTRGTDTDYTLGTKGVEGGKEIKVSKSSAKTTIEAEQKGKGIKVKRSALSKARAFYGKS